MLARTLHPAPHGKRHNFRPDYIAESMVDVNFQYLAERGVKAALIDLDGTVVARGSYDVPKAVSAHLAHQSIRIYIATNRPKTRSLKNLKELLSAEEVIHPRGLLGKPFPQYYAQAAQNHGLAPEQVVMIGDRFLQDIFGANMAGMTTIVIRKQDTPTNRWDRILSMAEKKFIERLAPKYKPV